MPKTWLSLAGAEIPDSFQGTVFLGDGIEEEPKYHLGFRERADERADCVRVMRDKRYSYHKNYVPFAPAGSTSPTSGKPKPPRPGSNTTVKARPTRSPAVSLSHGSPRSSTTTKPTSTMSTT